MYLFDMAVVLLLSTCSYGEVCRDGSEPLPCLFDPCDVTFCSNIGNVECVNNYCGGCSASFFVNGTDVTDRCNRATIPPTQCEDGKPPIKCKGRPCSIEKCPNYLDATCVEDLCTDCKAKFFVEGKEVTDKCPHFPLPTMCPNGSPPLTCKCRPCAVERCPRFKEARCIEDLCNSCKAKFVVGDVDVTDKCFPGVQVNNMCQFPTTMTPCNLWQCTNARCLKHPQAKCVMDIFGCRVKFFVNDKDVTNDCSYCTPSPVNQCPRSDQVLCKFKPCDLRKTTCLEFPKAECFNEYCGGCSVRWFLPGCKEVTECRKKF